MAPVTTLSDALTSAMFMQIFSEFLDIVKLAVPAVFSFIAFKVAWKWISRAFKR